MKLVKYSENTALKMINAILDGDIEAIKQQLAAGADVNAASDNGRTPLHVAAREGFNQIIQLLIDNGADVNANSDDYGTPLNEAIICKRVRTGNLLRKHGGKAAEELLIHKAASAGHIETVKQFIADGVEMNTKDVDGGTPLHYAAHKGHKEIVELLIANGVDVNAKNDGGSTPLHEAVFGGRGEVAELLIVKGADVNAKDNLGREPLDVAYGESVDLLRKHGGRTRDWFKAGESIHLAAEEGNIEAVKQHLAEGADVDAKSEKGDTPLHLVAANGQSARSDQRGQKEVAELLIANGADVNVKSESGWTPLYIAAFSGHKEVIELLIAKGVDVNEMEPYGSTPLDATSGPFSSPEAADLLRKHGGKTSEELSIHKAAGFSGTIEAVKQHIAAGTDVNAKDDKGDTPLHIAVLRGHKAEIAKLLIAAGADVNAKDDKGRTPLDRANTKGAENLIRKHGGKTEKESKTEVQSPSA